MEALNSQPVGLANLRTYMLKVGGLSEETCFLACGVAEGQIASSRRARERLFILDTEHAGVICIDHSSQSSFRAS